MENKLSKEALLRLSKLIFESDADFYNEFIAAAPLEEQAKFFREFPEFIIEEK